MSAADYDKLSLHEQIMLRPDTYVGSHTTHTEMRWIWNAAERRMVWRSVVVNPALLKLFDEVLVNALDHRVRLLQKGSDCPVKHIDVTVTAEKITVRNDGEGIPVDAHPVHKIYVPEMIFGNLLSGSNYKDKDGGAQERIWGGMNGYGAKLANIFSNEFAVETVDNVRQKRYKQVWRRNMFECGKPAITKATCKPFTEISFVPDLTRFKWEGAAPTAIPTDMVDIMCTRVIDAAACAGKDCKVTLNGVPVVANNFQKYVGLYVEEPAKEAKGGCEAATDDASETGSVATGATGATARKAKCVAYDAAGERWEVAAILTRDLHGTVDADYRQISFVNGINTRRGGKHVEYVVKQVMTAFCEAAKKKAKLEVTPAMLKDSVVFFVNSVIVNPSFDGQAKEFLTTLSKDFGSLPAVPPKFVDKLMKIGLLDEAQALLDAKNQKEAKKTDGRKRSTLRGIPKLEDASWAGTAKSAECTLILTEGDSAASTAIAGLKVVGSDRYGVFPLKGKILNVKDASAAKKTANQELTHIKQILGLEAGKEYKDVKQLRYGRIMIMTDQDVDGSHIKGLLMNLFHTEWPSLLRLGFLCCMMTPLLKATKGAQTLCFYSQSEYEEWLAAQGDTGAKGWKIKYYKGLGTSTAKEACEYFREMNTVDFDWDAESDNAIDLAFNKKRPDDRKEWLSTYSRERHLPVKAGGIHIPYTRFVHDELIHFSNADNIRSLPAMLDGLKPSQRKILWSCLKRNLTQEIKVAQLAGYVSEIAAYHHGEASLQGAIVGMAQDYMGSNNVNLLQPSGQFGTRLQGGKDAASPRYIFTALEPLVRTTMRKEDDAILKYVEDDGELVEPETYLPVVPLLLVNGAEGIGTGFSSSVPPHNPRDLVAVLRGKLADKTMDLAAVKLAPWWNGFQGAVVAKDDATWMTKGVYEFTGDDGAVVRIKELPVGTWTMDYKEFLESMLTQQDEDMKDWLALKKKKDLTDKEKKALDKKPVMWLKDWKPAYNDVDAGFLLYLDEDAYHTARAYPKEFEDHFKLATTFKTTNMVAFNSKGRIHRYANAGEMLAEFYEVRLAAYGSRKEKELARMREEIVELDARLAFVKAVVEKRLVVANAADADLLTGLRALGLPPLSALSAPDCPEDLKGYEYLLKMRVDRLKAAAVQELTGQVAEAKAAMAALSAKTLEALWNRDLDEFAAALDKYEAKRKEKAADLIKEMGTKGAKGAKGAATGTTATTAPKKVVRKVTQQPIR